SNLKIRIHGLYITTGHARDRKEHKKVEKEFLPQLARYDVRKMGFMEQVFLHQSYMWYYYILLDFERCTHHAHKWVEIFDKHPDMIKDDPVLYMRGLAYELSTLFSMRKRERYHKVMEKFETFTQKHEGNLDTTGRIIHFLYFYTALLNQHILNETFHEGIQLIPQIEKHIRRYGPL